MNLFGRQFLGEVKKCFARRRTYIGFGAFLVVEIAILGLLQLPSAQRAVGRVLEASGFLFEDYYSGLTLAFLMMTNTIFFLGSLYLALIAGDVVAKEVEDGTLRMILSRPISRWRLILTTTQPIATGVPALLSKNKSRTSYLMKGPTVAEAIINVRLPTCIFAKNRSVATPPTCTTRPRQLCPSLIRYVAQMALNKRVRPATLPALSPEKLGNV